MANKHMLITIISAAVCLLFGVILLGLWIVHVGYMTRSYMERDRVETWQDATAVASQAYPAVVLCPNEPLNTAAMNELRPPYPYPTVPTGADRQFIMEMLAPALVGRYLNGVSNGWNRKQWEKADVLRRATVNFEKAFNESGRNSSFFVKLVSGCTEMLTSCAINGEPLNQTACCARFRHVATSVGLCAVFDAHTHVQTNATDDVGVQLTIAFEPRQMYNSANARLVVYFVSAGADAVAFGSLAYEDGVALEPRKTYDFGLQTTVRRRLCRTVKVNHTLDNYTDCLVRTVADRCRCRLLPADLWRSAAPSAPPLVSEELAVCGPNETVVCFAPLLKRYGLGHARKHLFVHPPAEEKHRADDGETPYGGECAAPPICQLTDVVVVRREEASLPYLAYQLRVSYDWLGVRSIEERWMTAGMDVLGTMLGSAGFFLAVFLSISMCCSAVRCRLSPGAGGGSSRRLVHPAGSRHGADEGGGGVATAGCATGGGHQKGGGKQLPPLPPPGAGDKIQGTQTET